MKVRSCLGFYSCYIKNVHVDGETFYDLIRDSTSTHWTEEHEKLFQMVKDRISEDTIPAFPSTEYPIHIHVDLSNVGTGCIIIQHFPEGKRIISVNSRSFDEAEQKCLHSTRKCAGMSELFKLRSTTSLDLLFQPTCVLTMNPSPYYGDAKDSYRTVSFDISL